MRSCARFGETTWGVLTIYPSSRVENREYCSSIERPHLEEVNHHPWGTGAINLSGSRSIFPEAHETLAVDPRDRDAGRCQDGKDYVTQGRSCWTSEFSCGILPRKDPCQTGGSKRTPRAVELGYDRQFFSVLNGFWRVEDSKVNLKTWGCKTILLRSFLVDKLSLVIFVSFRRGYSLVTLREKI